MADTMGGYSLSDLSAVLGKDGAFGGNGSWLIMLLIFFLFFRNGSGFGGNFGEVGTPAATEASVRNILENQGTSQILEAVQGSTSAINALAQSTGVNFAQMENAICNVRATILETANTTNLSIKDLGTQLAMNNSSVLSTLQGVGCNIAQKISDSTNQINMNLLQGFNSVDKVLCDIRFNNEKNTSAIIQAGNANTDKILQAFATDRFNTLQTELALARAEISQKDQTAAIVAQLKGSCGCGCGNSCNC